MKTEPNEPINPIVEENFNVEQGRSYLEARYDGLTKREHIIIGLHREILGSLIIASGNEQHGWSDIAIANEAIRQGDELIKQLNKE
jgi:hypothetical protein